MPAPILAVPSAIAPVVGGASKFIPPIVTGVMKNPMLMGGAGMLAGAAANPVMDTMGRVNEYDGRISALLKELSNNGK